MNSTTLQSATNRDDPDLIRLWIYLLMGPIVYAGYFVAGYFWVEMACHAGAEAQAFWHEPVLGLPLLTTAELFFSLLAALVIGFATWRSGVIWRRVHQPGSQTEGSARFLALGGVTLGTLFFIMIVGTAVLLATLSPCTWI